MPLFVLMTKLNSEGLRDPSDVRTAGKQWLKKVKAACPEVRWIAHYVILGPYDFMDIYEAPDVETATRISLISRLEGAQTAESWQALPYERFLGLLEELQASTAESGG